MQYSQDSSTAKNGEAERQKVQFRVMLLKDSVPHTELKLLIGKVLNLLGAV